ncbi:hypothetical protein [Streptomyces sp. NPDC006739]|uniref:hypothetical protein n=1 Tax=Streptomyces sp. NPDC006739 TaxID=3364763 RepID=UPI0036A85F9E
MTGRHAIRQVAAALAIVAAAILAAALASLLATDPVTARLLWIAVAGVVAVGGGSLYASKPARKGARR